MARFLHVADIHLGFDRYNNRIRSKDFFKAFYDVLEIYAVGEQVDFVLIAGDLFEHRNIQPATLNQAQVCLNLLAEANIPAIAIEGNHDNRPYGTKTSWLRYLADWGSLIFLEPDTQDDGEMCLSAWDSDSRFGSYIDLDCGVRVIGTHWYGAVAPQAIKQIATAIQSLPSGPRHTVALFHHGLEGHVSRYAGALRYEELLPLQNAGVEYLALGHIHKSYAVEDWVFNPGSIEANSIEESRYERGVYLVTLDGKGVDATLCKNYYQRSIVRLHLKIKGDEVVEAVEAAALKIVEQAIATKKLKPDAQPIVELRMTGRIGFERADLDTRALQKSLQQISNALILLLRYDVNTVHYQSPLPEDEDNRIHIETDVYADLIASHAKYRHHTEYLSKSLCQLKELHLQEESEASLYQFVGATLNQTQETRSPKSLPDIDSDSEELPESTPDRSLELEALPASTPNADPELKEFADAVFDVASEPEELPAIMPDTLSDIVSEPEELSATMPDVAPEPEELTNSVPDVAPEPEELSATMPDVAPELEELTDSDPKAETEE